jgi:hypothetical protein
VPFACLLICIYGVTDYALCITFCERVAGPCGGGKRKSPPKRLTVWTRSLYVRVSGKIWGVRAGTRAQ